MANNLTLQFGTGLAKNTIFSALRQELIRRLTNCSLDIKLGERLEVIRQIIQLLVNSGHRFAFVKSVTLQAITRFKYMDKRSRRDPSDKKYRPLYRARSYDNLKRKVSKMVEHMTWFKGIETYDVFRNGWKQKIRTRNKKIHNEKECEKEVVAAMFIPPSFDSLLLKNIQEEEERMANDMDWKIKIIEQSG